MFYVHLPLGFLHGSKQLTEIFLQLVPVSVRESPAETEVNGGRLEHRVAMQRELVAFLEFFLLYVLYKLLIKAVRDKKHLDV